MKQWESQEPVMEHCKARNPCLSSGTHGTVGGMGRSGLKKLWAVSRPSRWTTFLDSGPGLRVDLGWGGSLRAKVRSGAGW